MTRPCRARRRTSGSPGQVDADAADRLIRPGSAAGFECAVETPGAAMARARAESLQPKTGAAATGEAAAPAGPWVAGNVLPRRATAQPQFVPYSGLSIVEHATARDRA